MNETWLAYIAELVAWFAETHAAAVQNGGASPDTVGVPINPPPPPPGGH